MKKTTFVVLTLTFTLFAGCGSQKPVSTLTALPAEMPAVSEKPSTLPEQPSYHPSEAPVPTYSPAPRVQFGNSGSLYLPSSDDENEYNAKDYAGADEFYDDHYDDFDNYEDAEVYWEENAE